MRILDKGKMEITANVAEVLGVLRKNREEHGAIVAEAREGYVKEAQKALEARLAQVREGKLVALSFNLGVPQDYTKVYDTMIRMLELHQGETIPLSSEQVRSLVMDQWDWQSNFLAVAANYSRSAALKNGEPSDDF